MSSIVNFGAFVDLGGVDGLVHVSELSWKHIDHPSEVVEVGQEVEVEVLDVDMDRERVSLSLKATQEDPWQQFARTHQIGQVVPGRVTKLVPFGAFVRVEEGIEGLVHVSELAERHVEAPEQVVRAGDEIIVKIVDIDLERRRISPEEGVPAVAFRDELPRDDVEPGVPEPGVVGGRVRVAPPHRGGSAEPAVLGAGPGVPAGGRQQPAAGTQPSGDPLEEPGLLLQRHVDEGVEADDGVEGVRREFEPGRVRPDEGGAGMNRDRKSVV